MELRGFRAGECFHLGGRKYLCTDVGSRTVSAVCLSGIAVVKNGRPVKLTEEEARRQGWLNGPPYALPELTLDEWDIEACRKHPGAGKRATVAARQMAERR
ncbi:MAG: hypothetical protein NTW87_29750 [Planctomycetota bacterium]|nr:hypothetical protein [Planctomycetota bacterium]